MAAPVNANINILVNTQQAMSQLRALQGQISTLNSSISATSGTAAAQQAALAKAFRDSANASRMWNARIVPINTAVDQFTTALDKGRMSLGQYTRYAASQLPGMSRVFRREFDMMSRVAEQNVKQMQTQFVQLGNSATGAAQAMALTPMALDKQASRTAVAAQRQAMMNRMIDLGTTKLLNWGKNTQWAGRQLMVGFSIPLGLMGAAAAKAFKEIDQGTISFKRVYGDLQTTTAEMERNLDAVKELGKEYTRYGNSLAETIELAAAVAATGARNNDLTSATEQTLRLATLGLMENAEAMEAVVALQTAFQISSDDLAETIDFLNVVENETILTMQDMSVAIPRVAPVIKGLGGDVKDLAVFMTALREGGVSAEQGANALKSGLGRLINPTKAAREEAEKYGISIDAIVQRNKGDLMGTVTEFGNALTALGQLEQQQVLQKVFGTYQYARLGALFKNIANDAGQAQRTMDLTAMSVEDLAKISERELSKIEEATSVKFQASIEKLKIAIAPIGETFMKALMPVIDMASKVLDAFNNLPDGIKNAIAIAVGAIAGIGPIVLMTVGLIANGIANIGKLVQTMRKFFARLRGDTSAFEYLTKEEREAAIAAQGLSGATETLTGKFLGQRRALESLVTMVGRYSQALSTAAAAAPLAFGIGGTNAARSTTPQGTVVTGPRTGGTTVRGPGGITMARGGVVPGRGNKDTVPAMLTPGESVVTKEATRKYGPMIQAMNAGTIAGFNGGVVDAGTKQKVSQSEAAKLVFAHGQEKEELTAQQLATLKALSSSEGAQQATRGQSLSNFGFIVPEKFNTGNMLGKEAARLFTDKKIVDRTMYPMYSAIAREMGNMTPEQAMQDPQIRGDVRRFAAAIARGLYSQTGKIKDAEFYAVTDKALKETRMSESSRAGIVASKLPTTVALYGGKANREDQGQRYGVGLSRQEKIFGQKGQVSYRSQKGLIGRAAAVIARPFRSAVAQSFGNNSASVHAEKMVTKYVDGLEVGAQKNTSDSAKAGRVVGNSFATSVKQSILTGRTAPGLIPGAAKMQYKQAQSASRREAYNIKEMQRVGMTDTQIIRQLERLRISKEKQAQAQQREATAAATNARLAQSNANLAQQSSKQMAVEEQARRRGLRTRVSQYFATPVGDGTQTRGQAIRGRLGVAGGGATMGLMGLSMAASMAGGSVGEMAQKIMPVTMGLMGLQMIIPMLTNPLGLAVVATTALVGGMIYLRKELDNAAIEAARMGANIGGVANGMKIIEDALGFKAPNKEDRLFRFTEEDRAAMTEFGSYFESEAGSKFIQDLKEATSEERYQKVSRIIAQAVGSGLEEERAKAFGFAIAEATGDALLKSSIARDFANQIFKSGSQALIDLEKQRMTEQPGLPGRFSFEESMPLSPSSIAGRLTGVETESPMDAALRNAGIVGIAGATATAGATLLSVGTVAGAIAAPFIAAVGAAVTGISALTAGIITYVAASNEQREATAEAAQGLGFALQTTQNLANAEAVLEEERRKGLISFDDYIAQQQELQQLQNQTADYIGKIFDLNADPGAMMQALGDQLSFAGFDEDQIKRVTERFSPDALAKQFFDAQSFADLEMPEQKDYVEMVFTKIMSGLTPENVGQRLQDLEGTYTNLSEDVVQKILDGSIKGVEDLDKLFNDMNMAQFIRERMGGGIVTGSRRTRQVMTPEQLSENITSQDLALKELGTDALEVFTRLTEFTDQDLSKGIMASKEQILAFGDAVVKLADYEEISIEVVMRDELDVDALISGIEKIKEFKFDKDIFGKNAKEIQTTAMSAEQFVKILTETGQAAGKTGSDIESAYGDAMTQYDELVDEVGKNKLGNIKITPQLIPLLFGSDVTNPNQIYNSLSAALPDDLPPMYAQILISAMGNDALSQALLSNPKVLEAVLAGKTTYEVPFYSAGKGGVTNVDIPDIAKPFANLFSTMGSSGKGLMPPVKQKEDKSGSGGGTDPLKELEKEIMERLALYTNLGKMADKYKNAKDSFEKIMEEAGYSGSLVAKLRKQGLSEMLIAKILSQGAKFAQEMLDNIKRTKTINRQMILGMAGEQVSDLVRARREDQARVKAAGRLRSENFTSEQISDILSDPGVAETLAGLKVGTKAWKGYIDELQRGQNAANAAKEALDPVSAALEEIAKAQEEFDLIADGREAKFQAEFGRLDREYRPRIQAQQDIVKGLEDQRNVIQEQIDDLERLNALDQRSIRSKQREIELLERRKQEIQKQISDIEYQNELDQRRIDAIRREDELRNRVSDALSQELNIMSDIENKIRDSYQERLDALDKIAEVNDYIINQQKNQLNLSQALSEGDIFAATAAAQEMRATSGQFAVEQTRAGIEQAMENQVAGLRTSEGLTREQAEQRIQDIQQQSYQTSLMIRDIEDQIYQRNLSLVPLKDSMRAIDEQILGYQNQISQIQDRIYGRETEILNIQLDKLGPLDRQIAAEENKLSNLEDELQSRKDSYIVDGLTYDQHQDMIDQQEESNRLLDAGIKEAARYGKQVGKVVDQWALAAKNIAEANRLARDMATDINTVAAADIEIIKADKSLTPSEAASGIAARRAAADAQLADIEARRQERIGLARQRAMDFQRSLGAYAGGLMKYAVGGMVNPLRYTSNEPPPAQMAVGGTVFGSGSRDSIAAMLTPGEFVVRKAMVDKYGVPMLNALNQGSFGMPRYNVGQPTSGDVTVKSQNTSNIMAPMYNNYSVNVSVSNANASADEIANRTIMKIKQMQDMQIRSNRGY